jgi:hypothetical protein
MFINDKFPLLIVLVDIHVIFLYTKINVGPIKHVETIEIRQSPMK